MRKQRVVLEHHVDRPLVRQHVGDVPAVEQDAALVRRLEAGEHAQQRGLAAAAGAEQRKELAGPDVERDVIDRAKIAEFFRDAFDAQQRHLRLGLAAPAWPAHQLGLCRSAVAGSAVTVVGVRAAPDFPAPPPPSIFGDSSAIFPADPVAPEKLAADRRWLNRVDGPKSPIIAPVPPTSPKIRMPRHERVPIWARLSGDIDFRSGDRCRISDRSAAFISRPRLFRTRSGWRMWREVYGRGIANVDIEPIGDAPVSRRRDLQPAAQCQHRRRLAFAGALPGDAGTAQAWPRHHRGQRAAQRQRVRHPVRPGVDRRRRQRQRGGGAAIPRSARCIPTAASSRWRCRARRSPNSHPISLPPSASPFPRTIRRCGC